MSSNDPRARTLRRMQHLLTAAATAIAPACGGAGYGVVDPLPSPYCEDLSRSVSVVARVVSKGVVRITLKPDEWSKGTLHGTPYVFPGVRSITAVGGGFVIEADVPVDSGEVHFAVAASCVDKQGVLAGSVTVFSDEPDKDAHVELKTIPAMPVDPDRCESLAGGQVVARYAGAGIVRVMLYEGGDRLVLDADPKFDRPVKSSKTRPGIREFEFALDSNETPIHFEIDAKCHAKPVSLRGTIHAPPLASAGGPEPIRITYDAPK